MNFKNRTILRLLIFPLLLFFMQPHNSLALQGQDRIPREYTNPDEVVTFDRNTPFQRAIDVINQFAQERLNKVIIDRTGTEGSIGISVPPMHWRDALDLLLRVKDLVLIEQDEIFEIVPYQEPAQDQGQTAQGGNVAVQAGQGQQGDGPVATIDSREVRINAIFFEGSRRALQEIGVDWSTLTENVPANLGNFVGQNQGGGGGGGGGQGGGGSGELPATSGFEDQFVSVNSKGAQNVSQNVFNALINFGQVGNSGIEVQALFSAFEADNLGEILASPSVKVMDRQEGRIQVGQDFSIKQRDFAGNVTDQFFSVGTILTVTPTIIEENDTTVIHLDIQAERSSAQPDPVSTIVNKQTAETQAILVDGEATAIAGLYRSEVAEVRRGVPILKDLPPWLFGLRYLFGFNSKDYQMRELVILVQAEIEPTIAERYGRENANKFDVLHEERERIRNEIERKDQYSPTRMEQLNADDEDEAEGSETELPEETIPEQEEQNSQEEEEMPGQQSREEETDEYLDPEMEAKPVPLNLGTEQENKNEEQSEAGESPVDGDGAESSRAEAVEPEPAADSTDEIAEPEGEQDTRLDSQGGSAGNYNYFIVAASFLNRENAVEFQQELREQGYDAVVVEDPDSSYHFVAYSGHQTLEEAKAELNTIWERHNADAWIFNAR